MSAILGESVLGRGIDAALNARLGQPVFGTGRATTGREPLLIAPERFTSPFQLGTPEERALVGEEIPARKRLGISTELTPPPGTIERIARGVGNILGVAEAPGPQTFVTEPTAADRAFLRGEGFAPGGQGPPQPAPDLSGRERALLAGRGPAQAQQLITLLGEDPERFDEVFRAAGFGEALPPQRQVVQGQRGGVGVVELPERGPASFTQLRPEGAREFNPVLFAEGFDEQGRPQGRTASAATAARYQQLLDAGLIPERGRSGVTVNVGREEAQEQARETIALEQIASLLGGLERIPAAAGATGAVAEGGGGLLQNLETLLPESMRGGVEAGTRGIFGGSPQEISAIRTQARLLRDATREQVVGPDPRLSNQDLNRIDSAIRVLNATGSAEQATEALTLILALRLKSQSRIREELGGEPLFDLSSEAGREAAFDSLNQLGLSDEKALRVLTELARGG